jgi:hypothetical protein
MSVSTTSGSISGGRFTKNSGKYDLLHIASISFLVIAFASYWDVFSHRVVFVGGIGRDPVWNPAHIALYAGFLLLMIGAYQSWSAGGRSISLITILFGIILALLAAGYNEIWHRVLGYSITRPEPFPIEPPHALLAVGFVVSGTGALLIGMRRASKGLLNSNDKMYISLLSGSLWLITAGSAFFVGNTYQSYLSYAFAVFVATFSSSLFVNYSAKLSGRFGYATLTSVWVCFVLAFFLVLYHPIGSPPVSLPIPIGIVLVLFVDYMITRSKTKPVMKDVVSRLLLGGLYGIVYYPLLDISSTLLPTTISSAIVTVALIGVSLAGATFEYFIEKGFVMLYSKRSPQPPSSLVVPKES